ncbi:MAG TPA: hypothetical protein VHY19_14325 [Steroidobacteraceae bacterium]|jgi:hypothetical protein|nr:hypothetical protein [Steroidobacteraceae bacterium]
MFEERFTHAFAHLGLSVHDISVSALAAAVITLGVVLMMELRCVLRMRQVVDNQLGRVFEQLDLLRFETQQLLEGQQSIELRDTAAVAIVRGAGRAPLVTLSPPVLSPHSAATASAATPAAARTTVTAETARPSARGFTAGEARLLSSLAQARSRRAEGVSA